MNFPDAVKSCFAQYATFSGRASRYEFWNFVLFILLMSVVLTVINSLAFGPTVTQELRVAIDSQGQQSQSIHTKYEYNSGWLGSVFGLIILLPWMAVSWRRMHDTDRSGWLCLLPVAAFALTFGVIFLTSVQVPVDATEFPAGSEIPTSVRVPYNISAFLIGWLISAASFLLVMRWFFSPSQPTPNKYGPNPHEVPS